MRPVSIAVSCLVLLTAVLITAALVMVYGKRDRDGHGHKKICTNDSSGGVLTHVGDHTLTSYKGMAYVLGGVDGGGSLKFINDLLAHFPHLQRIRKLKHLRRAKLSVNDIIFLQHLFGDMHISDVLAAVQQSGCRLVVNVHDWFYLLRDFEDETEIRFVHSAYLPEYTVHVPAHVSTLFALADHVLHPSQFTFSTFSKYFEARNFVLTPHIDQQVLPFALAIPPILGTVINIGVLHELTECKGSEIIEKLMKKVKKYRGFTIAFKIVSVNIPRYTDTEDGFLDCLALNEIHGLTLLNKWGETYCYALTKFLNSGLPILYNNFGAFKERIITAGGELPASTSGPYFKLFDTEKEFRAASKAILQPFYTFLDYILTNAGVAGDVNGAARRRIVGDTIVPPLYTFLLRDDLYVPAVWQAVHERVHPYCFYEPRHHAVRENDVLFYEGMTPLKTLAAYNFSVRAGDIADTQTADTPCLHTLRLQDLAEYDQSNQAVVDRQVEVATHWGMRGFCINYYWFSKNEVTGRSAVAQGCHDLFFKTPFASDGFNVFFNWENQDWSPGIANTYERFHLQAHADSLQIYFKHQNYLKVDNRPVFMLRRPWLLPEEQLVVFQELLNAACLANGFDGVHVSVNGGGGNSLPFVYSPGLARRQVNDSSHIPTLFFNFNDAARNYKRNPAMKMKMKTKEEEEEVQEAAIHSIAGTAQQHRAAADAAIAPYKSDRRVGLQKLLLVNSWNDWTQGTAVEPSTEKGIFYLKILKFSLSRVL